MHENLFLVSYRQLAEMYLLNLAFAVFYLLGSLCINPAMDSSPDLYGCFTASTPCSAELKKFLNIPSAEKCDQIKWKIYLYKNANPASSAKFRIERDFIYYVDNRTDKNMGSAVIEGDWKESTGQVSGKTAALFQLTAADGSVIRFRKLDENLIHLLNGRKELMVGDGGYGYTFSRIKI